MTHSQVMARLSERLWDMSDFFISTVGGALPISNALHERNHNHDVIRNAITSQISESQKCPTPRPYFAT